MKCPICGQEVGVGNAIVAFVEKEDGMMERMYVHGMCFDSLVPSGRAFVCGQCGRKHVMLEGHGAAAKYGAISYCQRCVDTFYTCHECGKVILPGEMSSIVRTYENEVVGRFHLCGECVSRGIAARHLVCCENCGGFYNNGQQTDVLYMDGDEEIVTQHWCHMCVDSCTHQCLECGAVVSDNIRGCPVCDRYLKPHPYHWGRAHNWYVPRGDGVLLGVELEIGLGDLRGKDAVKECIDSGLIHFERDSSIAEVDGVEMITQPCSLKYHRTEFPWGELCSTLVGQGFRSHDKCKGLCGLHVHVSRDVFGGTDGEAKADAFVNRNWRFFGAVGRRYRTFDELDESHYGAFVPDKDVSAFGKYWGHDDRYQAVNFGNDETVEFRFPKGTLNPETILGTLEMCHAIPVFVGTVGMDDILEHPANVLSKFVAFMSADERYIDAMRMAARLTNREDVRQFVMAHDAKTPCQMQDDLDTGCENDEQ